MEIIKMISFHPLLIIFMFLTSIYLSIKTRFVFIRRIGYAFKSLFGKGNDGEISSFQALMSNLAGTLGTGNIIGVGSAIIVGGPGSILWMWITAIFGGSLKYLEAYYAVKHRVLVNNEYVGGPMYYIEKAFSNRVLSTIYAICGVFSALVMGNMLQANAITNTIGDSTGFSTVILGIILLIFVYLVVYKGIKQIGAFTEKVMPSLVLVFILISLVVIFSRITLMKEVISSIFSNAFNFKAGLGGFLGLSVKYGISRGIFTHESGLGTSSFFHGASNSGNPVSEGLVASLSVIIDTLIMCSLTAFVILSSKAFQSNDYLFMSETTLSLSAFSESLGSFGAIFVTISMIMFGFVTIISWYYIGLKCISYFNNRKMIKYYMIIFIQCIFIGAILKSNYLWLLGDLMNSLLAIPNLLALIVLKTD